MKIEIDPAEIGLTVTQENGICGWQYRGIAFDFNEQTGPMVDKWIRRRVKRWGDERRRTRNYLGRRDTDFRLLATQKRLARHLEMRIADMSAHQRLEFFRRIQAHCPD